MDPVATAERLHRTRLSRSPIPMISSDAAVSVEDAYAVQAAGVEMRVADGERVVGGKLGFTSRAMQTAMGVSSPNYGVLTDAMILDGSVVRLSSLIHPKVEPEIAFLLGVALDPPVGPQEVLAATAAVLPCLEVVDSRYVDFRFTAVDNIADNSSAGLVAFGDSRSDRVERLDLLGVAIFENGVLRHTAAGAAALEHPARAVAWMVNNAPFRVGPGDFVISGGLTSPIDLRPGTVVTAEFDRIGPVTVVAAA